MLHYTAYVLQFFSLSLLVFLVIRNLLFIFQYANNIMDFIFLKSASMLYSNNISILFMLLPLFIVTYIFWIFCVSCIVSMQFNLRSFDTFHMSSWFFLALSILLNFFVCFHAKGSEFWYRRTKALIVLNQSSTAFHNAYFIFTLMHKCQVLVQIFCFLHPASKFLLCGNNTLTLCCHKPKI